MTNTFWINNPYILLDQKYAYELWPSDSMSSIRKLNAISRLVILLMIIGFVITKGSTRILISGLVTLCIIYILHKNQVNETFENPKKQQEEVKKANKLIEQTYYPVKPTNPFGNVLLTEINDTPNRKPAAPSFYPMTEKEIYNTTKDMVAKNLDPNNTDEIKEKLFKDLGDNFMFDRFMRNFYSTANTQVPSDQKSFAQFCYGDMISCRDQFDPNQSIACERDDFRKYPGY
jgi:hypothetical protein